MTINPLEVPTPRLDAKRIRNEQDSGVVRPRYVAVVSAAIMGPAAVRRGKKEWQFVWRRVRSKPSAPCMLRRWNLPIPARHSIKGIHLVRLMPVRACFDLDETNT